METRRELGSAKDQKEQLRQELLEAVRALDEMKAELQRAHGSVARGFTRVAACSSKHKSDTLLADLAADTLSNYQGAPTTSSPEPPAAAQTPSGPGPSPAAPEGTPLQEERPAEGPDQSSQAHKSPLYQNLVASVDTAAGSAHIDLPLPLSPLSSLGVATKLGASPRTREDLTKSDNSPEFVTRVSGRSSHSPAGQPRCYPSTAAGIPKTEADYLWAQTQQELQEAHADREELRAQLGQAAGLLEAMKQELEASELRLLCAQQGADKVAADQQSEKQRLVAQLLEELDTQQP